MLLVSLALFLFCLGQFQELAFAGLTTGWQAVQHAFGVSAAGPASGSLSTHGLVVGLAYRLLYVLLSILLLHLVLRGQGTRFVALGYAGGLGLSVGLLLLGQRAGLPLATEQGHRLLDLLSSPLAWVLFYGLLRLRRSAATVRYPKSGAASNLRGPV
ncbi:hypothetical protein D0T11_02220 [Hymenobacter rubripertinctus]|uniref:Uncharacterized protein n=1 Tax=Hymenobacter rubripertinctus TaxID=2029981 RepID=A0A418R7N8_9BACT|nr:hypothetical protein D0T11_02220 [Hymenobacter rubripertinctus]